MPTTIPDVEVILVTFTGAESDATLAELAAALIVSAMRDPVPSVIALFDGFNDDERGLYDIPAAVARAKRLVETGVFALFSRDMPEGIDGMGSLHLWAFANGLKPGDAFDERAFFEALVAAGDRVEAFVAKHSAVAAIAR